MGIELVQTWAVGAATSLFLLLALFLARDGAANRPLTIAGILFCAGAASRALLIEPTVGIAAEWFLPLLTILCVGHSAAFLTFTRLLFTDGDRIRPHDMIVWAMMVAAGLLIFRGGDFRPELANLTPLFTSAEIIAASIALNIAWRGIAGDLVERRRKARFAFVALASIHVMTLGLAEIALNAAPLAGWVGFINASGLLVVAGGLGFAIGGLRSDCMFVPVELSNVRRLREVPTTSGAASDFDLSETCLFERLNQALEVERVYRLDSLTVRSLAARLAVPQRALREMINRRLGYRNFNEFLNAHRLAEVKDALTDPEQIEVPISTMALDAGFRSLGPFNRAFRAAEGMTPTEYRRKFAAPVTHPISPRANFG